jgi:pimeloyl-ACP methyl ester carboxylesterase
VTSFRFSATEVPGHSDYLEPLEALASTGRQIIFYDQLGCGNSDRPEDKSMWTVDLYVEEVGVVRQALGLDRIHLLGQSWAASHGVRADAANGCLQYDSRGLSRQCRSGLQRDKGCAWNYQ